MHATKTLLSILLAAGAIATAVPAGATSSWAEAGATCTWNDPTPGKPHDPLEAMNTAWDAETAYWAEASFGPLDASAWIHVEGHRDGGSPQVQDDHWNPLTLHVSSTLRVQEVSAFMWRYGKSVQAVAQAWGTGLNFTQDADVATGKCYSEDAQDVQPLLSWYGGAVACDGPADPYALAGVVHYSPAGDAAGYHYFLTPKLGPSSVPGKAYKWQSEVTFPCHVDALAISDSTPADATPLRAIAMDRTASGYHITKAGP